jgi:hypothetical protein
MAIINYNKPRIIPFNPNSDPIIIGDPGSIPNPTQIPVRPTSGPVTTSSEPLPVGNQSMTSILNDGNDLTMDQLYHPEHKFIDQMDTMMSQMPVRNHPGLTRQILGGLAGAVGGPDLRDLVDYGHYNQNLGDWFTKLGPIETGANLERQNNVNARAVASQVLTQQRSDKNLERLFEKDREAAEARARSLDQGDRRLGQADTRLNQGQQRIDIARELEQGGTFKVDDNGIPFILRKDGTIDQVDDMSFLSWAKKEATKTADAKSVKAAPSGATGGSASHTSVETVDDPDNPGTKIAVIIDRDAKTVTKATLTKPTGEKVTVTPVPKTNESETQKAAGIDNKAKQIKEANGPGAKYINIDKNGHFTNITKPGYLFGPSVEVYQSIYRQIYGKDDTTVQTKAPGVQQPNDKAPITKTPGGKIVTPELRTKATDYLKANNKAIIETSIQAVIDRGLVK